MQNIVDTQITASVEIILVLTPWLTVKKTFYDALYEQVMEHIPYLMPGVAYELKTICGKDFWLPLGTGRQKQAGQIMVYMVEQSEIPLIFAETKHEYPKMYLVK